MMDFFVGVVYVFDNVVKPRLSRHRFFRFQNVVTEERVRCEGRLHFLISFNFFFFFHLS